MIPEVSFEMIFDDRYWHIQIEYWYIIGLLRGRTLGNSPTALRNGVIEVHSEEWLKRQLSYMSDCKRHK